MNTVELTGTIVPLVTPFAKDESFDKEGMNRLVDYVMREGADGLIATALTGEGPLLTADETKEVWDAVFERAAGRLPIVTTVITSTTRAAIDLCKAAEARGAAAIMLTPVLPELYAGRSHDDVVRFYQDVTSETSLPILLFNYPSLTGIDFVPPLVERLASIPNVLYIKESTGDIRRVHGIQRLLGDRISVVCGAPNVALESLALGCRVWITGVMNVAPKSARQLMKAVQELSDLTLARRIYYRQILPLVDVLAKNLNPTGTIKYGVCARGVDVGVPRRPGHSVGEGDAELMVRLVRDIAQEEARSQGILDAKVLATGFGLRPW
ncbi:MAG: dihydrodipicolinate synthase family protein [Polyangiaceae bacterium]|nr:dihydrodipicolinate synthase family protein [Polyangiaceae bacterium]